MVQEGAGFHLNIAEHLDQAAINAAHLTKQHYDAWKQGGYREQPTDYTRSFFCIAVGGGNTLKAHYKALLFNYCWSIDWVEEVRFFFLEESSGEPGRESARDSLFTNFIHPLGTALIARHGVRRLCRLLELEFNGDNADLIKQIGARMLHPIHMEEVTQAFADNKKALAKQLAQREAQRYQRLLKRHLGANMGCHLVLSGIGKDGELAAFTPYMPQLKDKKKHVVVLDHVSGSLRVAQGRGLLTAADCVSLIIAGGLKLNTLGRFEMDDSADFEQTVMETPIRLLRENREIAEKVHIFADERALHFEESVFSYREDGENVEIRAEVRDGLEAQGVHMLLMHGFMGLFSFINLLIRLPSAWRTSALHRGSFAKTLNREEIFPHYAKSLRKVMLKNWQQGRPVPAAYHSIAGVIFDHLLLSIVGDADNRFPEYDKLSKNNRQLVDALRASGVVHLASFATSDAVQHININGGILKDHYLRGKPLHYSSIEDYYTRDKNGLLTPNPERQLPAEGQVKSMDKFLTLPWAESMIKAFNGLWRQLMGRKEVQRKLLNSDQPYALRIIGGRLLNKISFYGLLKEISAAMHNPREYQRRHLRALEALIHYDIPYLSIIHQDDFMVSANRHREEYEYLLERRLQREGVKKAEDLSATTRFVLLERESEELPMDPLNPHLLVMSTTEEGNRLIRRITSEMTRFVNQNVSRAVMDGLLQPVPGVPTGRRRKGRRALG
jgi:6-phosphogluconolactonase/glucosamine-6-phosphate isomerase/deaminase